MNKIKLYTKAYVLLLVLVLISALAITAAAVISSYKNYYYLARRPALRDEMRFYALEQEGYIIRSRAWTNNSFFSNSRAPLQLYSHYCFSRNKLFEPDLPTNSLVFSNTTNIYTPFARYLQIKTIVSNNYLRTGLMSFYVKKKKGEIEWSNIIRLEYNPEN